MRVMALEARVAAADVLATRQDCRDLDNVTALRRRLTNRLVIAIEASDSASEALVDRALSRVFRIVHRVRFVAAAVLVTLAALFAGHGEPTWKVALALGAAGMLVAVGLYDMRQPRFMDDKRDVRRLFASVLTAQLVAITLTGGIRSPLIIVPPPIFIALAIGTGRIDLLKPAGVLMLVTMLSLALGDLLGWWPPEALVPAVFMRHDDRGAPGYVTLAICGFVTLSVVAGATGLYLRRAFRVALEDAVDAKAQIIEGTRAKHRELEALTGALAHELKNPLASISGLAGLLARKLPEASQESERMSVLLGEVKRMGHILDEFLNFSRPSEGLAVSDVAAARLVHEVVALHEGEAAQRRVRLVAEVATEATMHADPRKLKQVLVNLVQNALEASPPGATVIVRLVDAGRDAVAIEIEDEGGGLDPAIVGRLFSAGATTKPAGTGLGLVIARGITEQHGGRLTLENHNHGCVSRVVVPRAPATRGET